MFTINMPLHINKHSFEKVSTTVQSSFLLLWWYMMFTPN